MANLNDKVDKLVKDFVDAVEDVEKGADEKSSTAYKNFMDYDSSYFSDNDMKNSESKLDLPKENEFIYFVRGNGDKVSKVFKEFEEAKSFAIETNKFLFEVNGSDFYKEPMDLKSLRHIDLTKERSKKESVLGKIADYKKEEKAQFKFNKEKKKDIEMEM